MSETKEQMAARLEHVSELPMFVPEAVAALRAGAQALRETPQWQDPLPSWDQKAKLFAAGRRSAFDGLIDHFNEAMPGRYATKRDELEDEPMRLRTAAENLGNMNSQGPISSSPSSGAPVETPQTTELGRCPARHPSGDRCKADVGHQGLHMTYGLQSWSS